MIVEDFIEGVQEYSDGDLKITEKIIEQEQMRRHDTKKML